MHFPTTRLVLALAMIASAVVGSPTSPREAFNAFEERASFDCCNPPRPCCGF
jgi:hypothetical protein